MKLGVYSNSKLEIHKDDDSILMVKLTDKEKELISNMEDNKNVFMSFDSSYGLEEAKDVANRFKRLASDEKKKQKDVERKQLDTIQKRENLNRVFRLGKFGPGGAYHCYEINYKDSDEDIHYINSINFQKGPRHLDTSVHGITDQDLLEIVRDRLTCFATGSMPTEETVEALRNVEEALSWLNKRTEDRIERNVLGTYKE